MAFGTGHHATTAMIAEYLLTRDISGTSVFDMGCGSGILGIIACKAGAAKVEMADNDPVAVASARENILLNNSGNISVYHGGCEILLSGKTDLIVANINRPVLIDQMPVFYNALNNTGTLVISGILRTDLTEITSKAESSGFRIKDRVFREEWLMLVFSKPESQ